MVVIADNATDVFMFFNLPPSQKKTGIVLAIPTPIKINPIRIREIIFEIMTTSNPTTAITAPPKTTVLLLNPLIARTDL